MTEHKIEIDSYKARLFDLGEHLQEVEHNLDGHRKLITDICNLLEIGGGPVTPEAILGAISSLLPVDADTVDDGNQALADALEDQRKDQEE